MRQKREHPLATYSIHIPTEVVSDSLESKPDVQEYLTTFFDLRDAQESRIRNLAEQLLKHKSALEEVNGVSVSYRIKRRNFEYSFLPNPQMAIYCPLSHQSLTWSKKSNLTILIDAIAECETLAQLGYASH